MVFIKFFCCFEDQEKREELCKELEISEIKEKIVRWEISGKRHMLSLVFFNGSSSFEFICDMILFCIKDLLVNCSTYRCYLKTSCMVACSNF